jgi:hypothetical protein
MSKVPEVAEIALKGNSHEMIPVSAFSVPSRFHRIHLQTVFFFWRALDWEMVVHSPAIATPAPDIHARAETSSAQQEIAAEYSGSIAPQPSTHPARTLPSHEVVLYHSDCLSKPSTPC